MARTRATFTGTGAVVPVRDSASERQANAKIGVGLQYEFNPSFQMRVEAERYRVSDAVGYSDPKALRRAFHRWGAGAPSRHRRRPASTDLAPSGESPASAS